MIGLTDGLKQGLLVKVALISLLMMDRFRVVAQISWRWMKYHADQLQYVMNSGPLVIGNGCCCGEITMPELESLLQTDLR